MCSHTDVNPKSKPVITRRYLPKKILRLLDLPKKGTSICIAIYLQQRSKKLRLFCVGFLAAVI